MPDRAGLPYFRHLHIDDFEQQWDYFVKEYGAVTRADFLAALESGQPAPGVVLTFDDGLKDHYDYVLPRLQARGLWGLFYVPTGVYAAGRLLDVHRVHLLLGRNGSAAVFALLQEIVTDDMITEPLPHFVAVPTTAGTGSEVGRSSVISDDVTHVKKIVFSPALLAKAVFADPELTVDLPPAITAATGMDALTHNVESFLSPAYHPLCDGIAVEGVRIAAAALPIAAREGRNLGARGDMLMSSMMGAIAFQKDLGAVHSCAHALSTVADLHHGLANGIMIDHVMRFNAPAASAKLAELARVARVPGGDSGSDEARADAFVAWLVRLKSDLGIPAKLSHYAAARRVTADDIARLVEIAVADTCHQTNPRPCTADDFRRIFAAAM